MDGEVFRLLERVKDCIFRAQLPCAESVWPARKAASSAARSGNDDLDDQVQIGQGVAGIVLEPVVGVAPQNNALLGHVAGDGEGAGADDRRGVGVNAPRCRRTCRRPPGVPVYALGRLRFPWNAGKARMAWAGRFARRKVVQGGHRHSRFPRLAAGFVPHLESERRATAGGNIVVVDDLIEGKCHVMGGEVRSVVPANVVPQAEGPGQAVVGMFPGIGQGRLHPVGQPGGLDETLEEVTQHAR